MRRDLSREGVMKALLCSSSYSKKRDEYARKAYTNHLGLKPVLRDSLVLIAIGLPLGRYWL